MKFEQWWEQLSDAERRFIGIYNARFVWLEGFHIGFTEGFKEGQETLDIIGEADANSR